MRMRSWRTHPALSDLDGRSGAAPAGGRHDSHESPYSRPGPARITRRPCLCCGRAFDSEGPHNRLCDDCRNRYRQSLAW